MMGELKYFLGFQIKQLQDGTFISQTKYIPDILKKFGMKDGKPIKTPMGTCWGRASVRRRSYTKKQFRLKSSPGNGRRFLFYRASALQTDIEIE
jgi:hypothetical protein